MALQTLAELQEIIEEEYPDVDSVREGLLTLSELVKEGGPSVREDVISADGYQAITKAWAVLCYGGTRNTRVFSTNVEAIREASLEALYSLTAGFPEIIDEMGWIMINQAVDHRMPTYMQILVMKVIRNVCIGSEENRENISFVSGTIDPLIALIKREDPDAEFVREWCGAMKALILSDDPRVAYNRAPERKRMIHSQRVLPILTQHLETFEGDEATLNAIVILLGSLAVNEDVCIEIDEGNPFPSIFKIFKAFPQNRMLMKNTISFLRYLNVSDVVRQKCAAYGFVKWLFQLLFLHKNHPDFLEVGTSCLAFMTLKNACHAAQVVQAKGTVQIIQSIKDNPEELPMLKAACLTLRNVAASGGSNATTQILEADGETVLRELLNQYPELTEHYVKPTLNDLGVLSEQEKVPFAKLGQQDTSQEAPNDEEYEGEGDEEVQGEVGDEEVRGEDDEDEAADDDADDQAEDDD